MILLSAETAGAAQYIVHFIRHLDHPYTILASRISAFVFEGIPHRFDLSGLDPSEVKLVVAGTCIGHGIDKTVLAWAIDHGLPSASIVDHWSWYRERFMWQDRILLPDQILVIDEVALREAVAEGLPENKMIITGQPALEAISSRKISLPEKEEWQQSMGLDPGEGSVCFISEQLKDDFPKGSPQYPGFDEYVVVDDVVAVLPEHYRLLIKLHPEEDPHKYDHLATDPRVRIIGKTNIDALIRYADHIVGMGSILLIEGAFFRSDIVSYRPGENRPFIGNKIGATTLLQTREALQDVFNGKRIIKNDNLQGKFDGSAGRVIDFIRQQLT